MTTPIFDITEGWTEPLVFQLEIDAAAFDASGIVALDCFVRDKHGVRVTIPVDWSVQTSSQARLSPSAGDFRVDKSPYTVRFVATDGSGKAVSYPQAAPETIKVWAL
jgi:uncharacterized protein YcbX